MKTPFALVAAVSVALILDAAGASAGELPFAQSNGGRDWTAAIGNGHTTSNTAAAASAAGSPSSAHWSAAIGTGQVSGDLALRAQAVATNVAGLIHVATSQAPSAHWTSKIGTAHASDSNRNAQNGKIPS